MTWYMSITRCFITLIWSCFPRRLFNPMHYAPQYLKQIRLVYNIFLQLLNTRLILLWMMTSNWFLMYVYRLITWYRKLGKQQQLFVKVSMRLDILWSTLRSIYIVMDFKRLGRLSVLKQH